LEAAVAVATVVVAAVAVATVVAAAESVAAESLDYSVAANLWVEVQNYSLCSPCLISGFNPYKRNESQIQTKNRHTVR
jgi:hypothetical protein